MSMDHYNTLGVAKNATPEEIKKAYRKLAAQHHPDRGGNTAEFQKVQQAYDTLSDPEKRRQYDMPGPQGFTGGFPGGFSFNVNGFDINDIFSQFFGQQTQRPHMPSYRTMVNISLEQAYNGDKQVLQLNTHNGPEIIEIQIPKGVQHGQSIRYDNLMKNSILVVDFRIFPHSKFEREGSNLFSVHEIDVLDLIIGTEFEFTAISGKKLTVVVPPQTQPNNRLRLSGEGMPTNTGFGDQYIVLKPYVPAIINKEIIDIILKYKKS